MEKTQSNGLYDKYFEQDKDSIKFKGEKLLIVFPEKFIDKRVAVITNKHVAIMGIFKGYIFDDADSTDLKNAAHVYTFKSPSEYVLTPSLIEEFVTVEEDSINETMKRVKMIKLTFFQGDNYIVDVNTTVSTDVLESFMNMILDGQLPDTIKYSEIPEIWNNCNQRNGGGDLSLNFNSLCSIVAGLTRCPDDYTVPFRIRYKEFLANGIENGKMIRLYDIPKFTSNFCALTSADPKHGITVAMGRTKSEQKDEVITPVEHAIK